VATTASAYLYKKPAGHDCGKVTFTGGFGGPLPSNIPKNAEPQIHTFIVKGSISCAKAKQIMSSFEKSAVGNRQRRSRRPAGSAASAPSSRAQSCTNAAKHVVLSNGIVYVVPK